MRIRAVPFLTFMYPRYRVLCIFLRSQNLFMYWSNTNTLHQAPRNTVFSKRDLVLALKEFPVSWMKTWGKHGWRDKWLDWACPVSSNCFPTLFHLLIINFFHLLEILVHHPLINYYKIIGKSVSCFSIYSHQSRKVCPVLCSVIFWKWYCFSPQKKKRQYTTESDFANHMA